MARLLIDSHAFLWYLMRDAQLSSAARLSIHDPANECFVSHASLWELGIKIGIGKLRIGYTIQELIVEAAHYGWQTLHIDDASIAAVSTLHHHHRDPFDRMLVAQAITHGLTVVTKDQNIPLYGVPVLW